MKKVNVTCCLCTAICCLFLASASAEESKIQPEKAINTHKIIRIEYTGAVNPSVLKVEPGSTVVWINEAQRPIEIQFEGKQVTLACKSPVHFVLDENGSFLSDRISTGAVASLCFIEKGEYTYKARASQSPSADWHQSRPRVTDFEGKIIVQ